MDAFPANFLPSASRAPRIDKSVALGGVFVHPWEARSRRAIFPVLAFVLPVHIGVFFLFLMIMTARAW